LDYIHQLNHQHLIKHAATCQRGESYYIIFPWANGGDLQEFWEYEDPRERTPELILWSFQQMLGLASALKALHLANYCHGDLAPEHILHFRKGEGLENNSEGILALAGCGRAEVYSKERGLMRRKPRTATSSIYQAPEALLSQATARSRRKDMWPIGCVFLEFVIWLLYGHKAIERFEPLFASRKSNDPRTQHGRFFYYASEGTLAIHPAVSAAIGTIRTDPRCKETALADLVEIIAENLLQIEVSLRVQATELYEKLEKIVQKAEKNPSYLVNLIDSVPNTPAMFR
jgi:serine/threonine protein kinase